MPNPKTQTVTFNIKEALDELKKGRVEYRADKGGVVHLAVAKLSMEKEQIAANAVAFIQEVVRKRPSDLKGDYVHSIVLSSTMGPGDQAVPEGQGLRGVRSGRRQWQRREEDTEAQDGGGDEAPGTLAKTPGLILSDFRGLTFPQMIELRVKLGEQGTTYRVVRNASRASP